MDLTKFDRPGDPITRGVLGDGKANILFVGRLIPNKKFEDLIKTFYFYKKYFNPASRLILAGDHRGLDRYLSAILDLIGRLGLQDVHLTGHVDFAELLAFYEIADIYLSLSEHEGFGVPLLEAFHKRIPVVGFDAGAVAETMNGGGVVVAKKDFLRLAALIDVLVKDRELRRRVVEGQLEALRKFSRENVSLTLLDHVEMVSRG